MRDTEVVSVLKREVEFHDEGVVQERENLLFSTDVLNFLLPDDVSLVQYLHCREEGWGRGVSITQHASVYRQTLWDFKISILFAYKTLSIRS